MPEIAEATFDLDALQKQARASRPQLAALQSSIERGEKALEFARKDYLPDFDVRLQYGQRDRTTDCWSRFVRRQHGSYWSVTNTAFSLPVTPMAKLTAFHLATA